MIEIRTKKRLIKLIKTEINDDNNISNDKIIAAIMLHETANKKADLSSLMLNGVTVHLSLDLSFKRKLTVSSISGSVSSRNWYTLDETLM
jgi:hypothetical protein